MTIPTIPVPVRKWLYGVGLAVAPVLVARGLVDATEAGLWVALAGAVLAVNSGAALANAPRKGKHVAPDDGAP